jgi:hypothetical protein
MTFIASVIAKEGVAIVADSFRTTLEHTITEDDFFDYLGTLDQNNRDTIPTAKLIELFDKRPSSTRNYVDKLFKFDDFSAITTTGAAYINGKEIKDIIGEISAIMQVDEAAYKAKTIEEKLTEFCDKVKAEVLEHLKSYNLSTTEFIFSHFNVNLNKPQIFMVRIKETNKDSFDENDPELVTYADQTNLGIVTDGQDTYVDRLIFGTLYTNIAKVKSEIIDCVVETLVLSDDDKAKITNVITEFGFMQKTITDDMFSINFRELSLQEAVNLATLLMKIVMDIQVYTEKIPTVGGLIRTAVIKKDTGFSWISGNTLEAPKIF